MILVTRRAALPSDSSAAELDAIKRRHGIPYLEHRPDARRFETWEIACALHAGLGAAIEYAQELGLEPIRDRVRYLAHLLREDPADLPGAEVRDLERERCAIVSFTVDGLEPMGTVAALPINPSATNASVPSRAETKPLVSPLLTATTSENTNPTSADSPSTRNGRAG